MDLREVKTKRNIRNAFLEIRSRKALEKITIKELCERAEISKATFYLHYRDIYDLSDTLQMDIIKEMVRYVRDPKDYINDPRRITRDMIEGFYANRALIDILFSGAQFSKLPERIESEIKARIFSELPELENDIDANVQITYQITGVFYSFHKYERSFGFDGVMTAVDALAQKF